MRRLLWLIIVFHPLVGRAIVDMKNSNYAETWIDITVPGTGFDLRVQRYYNSRAVFNGMFGYGWCTDFESTLTPTPEGNLRYQECGAGQEIIYTRGKSDAKEVEETINKIIAYAKKTNRSATPESLEHLRGQLRDDAEARIRLGAQAEIKPPEVKEGVEYAADTLEVEKIVRKGDLYVRTVADGTTQKFNTNGKLVVMQDKNGNYLKLIWNGDQLKEVIDNSARKLGFQHYPNKRVKDITGPGTLKATYTYQGEDLSKVVNMWENTYVFKYDDNHNLTRVNYPDGTFKALTYNSQKDWVTSFTERVEKGGTSCTETYTYDIDNEEPKNHFRANAIKKCGKEIKNQAQFEFWHKTRSDGGTYLFRVLTKSNTDLLDITYHPDFGRPISIRKGTVTTTFSYYPNGLVREKSTQNTKLTFDYKNAMNKVSRVSAEFFDEKGKAIRKRETNFEYDDKGNLKFAKNSDGQTVRLTYDNRGRIKTIVDQAKKEVQITYDERSNKPSVITRPKVGSIVVTYQDNEIKKVDSKDGPTVAVQVASTFNNLLDIIAPATSELNL